MPLDLPIEEHVVNPSARRPYRPWITVAVFLALLFLVIAARLPFLSETLRGEEGSFAYLVAGSPASSQLTPDGLPQMMIGMLDGAPVFWPFQRTILPYVLLENGPGPVVRALDVFSFPPAERTAIVRGAFLAVYLIGVAGLMWRVASLASTGNVYPMAVAAFAVTAPLAVAASIQPQIDGALGVMLAGVAAILLIPMRSGLVPQALAARALAAGILVGLGRHEWSIAFGLGAVVVLLASLIFLRHKTGRKPVFAITAPLLAGMALSAMLSYWLSPTEYVSGFAVQQRLTGVTSPVALAKRDVIHIVSSGVLLLPLFALLIPKLMSTLRDRPGLVVVTVAAFVLWAGALSTGWPGDGFPRYYAPVFIMAATALVSLPWPPRLQLPLGVVFLIGIVWAALIHLEAWRAGGSVFNPARSVATIGAGYDDTARRSSQAQTLPLAHSGIWLYYPEMSFIGADLGKEGAKAFIDQNFPSWSSRLSPTP